MRQGTREQRLGTTAIYQERLMKSLYMSAVKMHVDKNLRSDALQCHSSNLHRVT